MDLKSTLIGIVLLILAFFLITKNSHDQQNRQINPNTQTPVSPEKETNPRQASSSLLSPVGESEIVKEDDKIDTSAEKIHTIENDFIRVRFTNHGGAIKEVALLQYPETKGSSQPYRFNAGDTMPALGLSHSKNDLSPDEFAPLYDVVNASADAIVFSRELKPGVILERSYRISEEREGAAPYTIKHSTRFINHSESSFNIDRLYVDLGTAAPTEADPHGQYLNFGYYNGKKTKFVKSNAFQARRGFMGIGQRAARNVIRDEVPITWASVKNQFFATVLTPESSSAMGYYAQPAVTDSAFDIVKPQKGITSKVLFQLEELFPDSEQTLSMDYYVGPKEFPRLNQLDKKQDLIMQFGWFSLLSEWLLIALINIESFVGNYGTAIIIMTVIIRLIIWPMTLHSSRSMKRMAQLQEPMRALQAKYKDKPQKLQKEMAKLYKEHKVNPVAGCLPILLQFPIFLSFFYMLRTASELRFAEFLWIKDLSQPENIINWGIEIPFIGSYLNILPLLMGLTMFYQMKMTPGTLDRLQQKIFLFMPIIFTVICYTFSSGLVLYWTVSSVLSIFQQSLTKTKSDKKESAIASESTPVKKEKKSQALLKKPAKK